MRRDKPYIGTEETEFKPPDKELFIEEVLFILIGAVCIVFSLTRPDLAKTLPGLFIFLVLSPFGAHLTARGLIYIWKKTRCAILN